MARRQYLDPVMEALVQRRHDLGLTQTIVGDRMRIPQNTVSAIERGRDVRLSTLRLYAEALDADLVVVP